MPLTLYVLYSRIIYDEFDEDESVVGIYTSKEEAEKVAKECEGYTTIFRSECNGVQ